MIISHDGEFDIMEYTARGKEYDIPILDTNPSCKCIAYGNVHQKRIGR
jgi:hypothetical protein